MAKSKQEQRLTELMNSPEGLEKIAEQMLAPLKKDLVYESRLRQLFKTYSAKIKPLPICAKCKREEPDHYSIGDHPFMNNNLEMLEWMDEQRKTV